MSTPNERIRHSSGMVDDQRPLVAFLYVLMCNHLGTGAVEGIVNQVERGAAERESQPEGFQFSNGWLAEYAQYLAGILTADTQAELDSVRGTLRSHGFHTIAEMSEYVQGLEQELEKFSGKPIPLSRAQELD